VWEYWSSGGVRSGRLIFLYTNHSIIPLLQYSPRGGGRSVFLLQASNEKNRVASLDVVCYQKEFSQIHTFLDPLSSASRVDTMRSGERGR